MPSPTFRSQTFQTTRLTLDTPLDFDLVLDGLYLAIGDPSKSQVGKILAGIKSFDPESQEEFEKSVNEVVKGHGFMIFNEYNHGRWIPLFNVGALRKAKRIVLGNPLMAITMLKEDLRAGLAVPVEILLLEKMGGGTEIIWNLPSSLIVGADVENEALVKAAKVLDRKLEDLLKSLARDGRVGDS